MSTRASVLYGPRSGHIYYEQGEGEYYREPWEGSRLDARRLPCQRFWRWLALDFLPKHPEWRSRLEGEQE